MIKSFKFAKGWAGGPKSFLANHDFELRTEITAKGVKVEKEKRYEPQRNGTAADRPPDMKLKSDDFLLSECRLSAFHGNTYKNH